MQKLKFTLWDVEHGISIWIQTPNNHHHWLDLGKTSDFSPSNYVSKEYSVSNIDFLIISHPDKDHLEDLPYFIKSFKDPRVLHRNKSLPDREFSGSGEAEYQQRMRELHQRFTEPVPRNLSPMNLDYNGGVKYHTFSLNYGEFSDGSQLQGNNTSIVTFISYVDVLFVCPGDIEPKGWNELVHLNGNDSEIQSLINDTELRFLVAPHHGRESGYSKEMMDLIQPHAVFISDKWGASTTHPEYYKKPLGIRLNQEVKKCFSTKTKGRVLCEVSENGQFGIHQYEVNSSNYPGFQRNFKDSMLVSYQR